MYCTIKSGKHSYALLRLTHSTGHKAIQQPFLVHGTLITLSTPRHTTILKQHRTHARPHTFTFNRHSIQTSKGNVKGQGKKILTINDVNENGIWARELRSTGVISSGCLHRPRDVQLRGGHRGGLLHLRRHRRDKGKV